MNFSIKSLWQDHWMRGTLVLTFLNLTGAALNFLVHPILARFLSVVEYGEYQSILSILMFFSIVSIVYYTMMTKAISTARTIVDLKHIYKHGMRRGILLGLIVCLVLSMIIPFLSPLLRLTSVSLLPILLFALFWTLPFNINQAVINGTQQFTAFAVGNFSEQGFRLFWILVFISAFGWRLPGVAFALGLGTVCAFFVSRVFVRRSLTTSVTDPSVAELEIKMPELLLISCFALSTQFVINFDMLFVKAVFSPNEAGYYGALLTIGRIVFFLGYASSITLLPVVARMKSKRNGQVFHALLKALSLSILLALPGVLVFSLFSKSAVLLLFGPSYLPIASFVPLFTLIMLLLALINILAQFFLALNRRDGLVILLGGIFLEIALFLWRHESLEQIVGHLALVFTSIFVAQCFCLLVSRRRTFY